MTYRKTVLCISTASSIPDCDREPAGWALQARPGAGRTVAAKASIPCQMAPRAHNVSRMNPAQTAYRRADPSPAGDGSAVRRCHARRLWDTCRRCAAGGDRPGRLRRLVLRSHRRRTRRRAAACRRHRVRGGRTGRQQHHGPRRGHDGVLAGVAGDAARRARSGRPGAPEGPLRGAAHGIACPGLPAPRAEPCSRSDGQPAAGGGRPRWSTKTARCRGCLRCNGPCA